MGKQISNQSFSRAKKGKNINEGTKRGRVANIVTNALVGLSVVMSISVVTLAIVFFFSAVDGPSMMNTLNPDYVLAARGPNTDSVVVNRFAKPKVGDIIVTKKYKSSGASVDSEGNRYDLFIKRAIALEGTYIYFEKLPLAVPTANHRYWYQIQINGEVLDEVWLDDDWGRNLVFDFVHNYITNKSGPYAEDIVFVPGRGRNEILVPEGHLFYMGDNRGGDYPGAISDDCTSFGPEPVEYIMGVVADIAHEQNFFRYIADKLVHFVTFRWIFG